MSLATLARKTRAKQRLRTRGNFILNMTGRGNVLGMNAKMSRGNCKGLTKCAGKRAACCVGVGPQDNCNKIVVPTTQPDLNMVAAPAANPSSEYGFSALGNFYGDLTPASNLLNIDTTQTVNGGTLNVDPSIGATGTFYYVPGQLNTTASFTTITFVEKDTGASVSYYYSASVPYMGPGGGRQWTNSTAQKNFWNVFLNYTTFIKIFIDNTNPNVGPPYFSDPCCCQFKHGGKPAPQMGYGVYLNRKSKGAYHPGGGPQCCTSTESGKIVYKQPANISAGEVVEYKKTSTVACYHQTNNNSSLGSAHCASEGCTGKNTYIELYKYKMRVGSDDPTNPTEWGYDNVDSTTFGSLCHATFMGFRINTMEFEENNVGDGYHFELSLQTNNINNPTQCSIQSITFVDSLDQ